MGILTEEMKRVVAQQQLCYPASATPDGKPNLSPKGSITVLSDDELGFADLASPGTIENLRHNPAIELNLVDPFTRRGFRFKGRAEIVKNDPEAHRRIAQILGPDYPFEQVVKVRVETAAEVFSPIYTLTRGFGLSDTATEALDSRKHPMIDTNRLELGIHPTACFQSQKWWSARGWPRRRTSRQHGLQRGTAAMSLHC
jgi:predicted pyridoxine 5'-phosphate oxidase superfamily flavin-nucleotide-binding protein